MAQPAQGISAYRNRGLLIDTNLLLLFFVGNRDRTRIAKFKRTKKFTEADYDLLLSVLRRFTTIVTTPHILTEVSNLIGQLPDEIKQRQYQDFANVCRSLQEDHRPAIELATRDHFPMFGLTDSGIIEDARGRYLVLTEDLPLYSYLLGVGVDAVNFNHLRTLT